MSHSSEELHRRAEALLPALRSRAARCEELRRMPDETMRDLHDSGLFPKAAQDEVWNPSPDTLIATSFVFPAGRAKKVEGGYLLSGRWPFSSGVDHSDWNMLAGMARLDDNAPAEPRVFLVHKSQYV